MPTAIEFNNISKIYRLGLVSTGTLANDIHRWWTMNIRGKEDPYLTIGETNDRSTKGESDYVWALRDIDFKVEQGDVVGIIGKNGAGKSTLLKILSKVTAPTTGTIRARGRIGSLLEVGTGFHGEMTGRENIYLNGAILGMTKPEINKKLDEIIDFSGCERYIDTPVKRYSSGMMVRLGFAVAAHLDPEILVVDEVLAVGDAEFQKKAIGKMQDVSRGEGRTVLFVSHNMGSIKALCNNCILLEKGRISYMGTTDETVKQYLTRNDIVETRCIDRKDHTGTGEVIISDIFLTNCDHSPIKEALSGQSIEIHFKYISKLSKTTDNIVMGIAITDEYGDPITLLHSRHCGVPITLEYGSGEFVWTIEHLPLNEGQYHLKYSIAEGGGQGAYFDYLDNAYTLQVIRGDFFISGEIPPRHFGPFLIANTFRVNKK